MARPGPLRFRVTNPATPTPFLGLHHVAIIASDIDRSRHFYTTILGFTLLAEEFRAARNSWKVDLILPSGGLQLELFSFPNAPARPNSPEAQGLRHLAFKVTNLDAALARLAQHNIPAEPVRTDHATNRRFTFFKDPDGLPLEIYES